MNEMAEADSALPRDKIAQVYLQQWGDSETVQIARSRIDWLASNAEGPAIIDLGCSEGILPILIGRRGNKVTGVDINPDAIAYGQQLLASEPPATQSNVDLVCDDLFKSDFEPGSFDTVVIGEIIEHLESPELLIDRAHALLRNEGRLLLTTPFGHFPDPDHRQTFTLSDICKLLSSRFSMLDIGIHDGYIRVMAKKSELADTTTAVTAESLLKMTEQGTIESQVALHRRLEALKHELEEAKHHLHEARIKYRNVTARLDALKSQPVVKAWTQLMSAKKRVAPVIRNGVRLYARKASSDRERTQD